MATQTKIGHTLKKRILRQLKSIQGVKDILLFSVSNSRMELFKPFDTNSPKTSTDKFYETWHVCMKVESELKNSTIKKVTRGIMPYFNQEMTLCLNFLKLFPSWNKAGEKCWWLSKGIKWYTTRRKNWREQNSKTAQEMIQIWTADPFGKLRRKFHIPKIEAFPYTDGRLSLTRKIRRLQWVQSKS